MTINGLRLGLRKHWKNAFLTSAAVLGAIWTLIEFTTFFFDPVKIFLQEHNMAAFLWTLAISIFVGLTKVPLHEKTTFIIPTTNTKISVEFADFFAANGSKAFAVNENFDTEIGDFVAQHSVHGQFIQKVMQGNSRTFSMNLEKALNKIGSGTVKRGNSKVTKFAIGTTAILEHPPTKYFLFALTNTDQTTGKASASVSQMMAALDGLWKVVRNNSNGDTVNIPLVGAGQSGVGLQPVHLVRLIVMSILIAVRIAPVCNHIRIVLHPSTYDQIDLDEIKRDWK
jgi:Domain of unknown function (DUF6430)